METVLLRLVNFLLAIVSWAMVPYKVLYLWFDSIDAAILRKVSNWTQ
jgi:hypothetical protein